MADRHSGYSIGRPAPFAGAEREEAAKNSESKGNGGYLKSRVLKRSIVVGRHKTSVSLEDVFWNELRAIAQSSGLHLSQLVARIDAERQHGNLSSAIRLFVFEHRIDRSVDGQQSAFKNVQGQGGPKAWNDLHSRR